MYRIAAIVFCVALACSAGAADSEELIAPAQWLARQEKPRFREGHTLPRLTRFGWTLPLDARIELAENWGYALEFGGYTTDAVVDKALNDPNSDQARLIALTASDPRRYPLCIILSRDLPADPPPETFARNAAGEFLGDKQRIWSPEAPRSVLEEAAELRARPLRRLRQKVPVAMILNGGEYALGVLGFCRKYWEQDPRILAARGDSDWFTYISQRKALMEIIIADAVRKAAPDRTLYIYYTAGGGTHRNRTADWQNWCYGFEWMRTASDLPSNEYYYRHFNDGWTGKNDMLTQALNARGMELRFGCRFSYDWLCAGWIDESKKTACAQHQSGRAGRSQRRPAGRPPTVRGVPEMPVHGGNHRRKRRLLRLSAGGLCEEVPGRYAAALAAPDGRAGARSCAVLAPGGFRPQQRSAARPGSPPLVERPAGL